MEDTMGKKKDLLEERVYVHLICLLGRPIHMNYTLPTSIYTERLYDFDPINSGYVAEIIFDIVSSDAGDICMNETTKVGEIHGYIINVERMKRDKRNPKDEFCNGDDITDLYWDMAAGLLGDNPKSNNIFYIDSIFIKKQQRHDQIATASLLILPMVLYEQFNVELGYLAAKAIPILDDLKHQKKDLEIYRRLCYAFWSRLGFDTAENYMYYNMANDFVKENVERLAKKHRTDYVIDVENYACCCDIKVLPENKEIHVLEYAEEPYHLDDKKFPLLQKAVLEAVGVQGEVHSWRWIFYNYQGKVREYGLTGFVSSNIRDDSYYVRMLDYYKYLVGQV